jgi:hypothetical protein
MSLYQMTIKTETAKGTKIQKTICHGAEAVAQEREHYRSLAPKGSTQTITVEPLKR